MIAQTKVRYLGNGNILLMWGYLIVAVALSVWVLLSATHQGGWNWLWFAIPAIGFPVNAIMKRRQKRECYAVTYSDRVTARLWMIFGVSVIILSLVCLGFDLMGDVYCWSAMLVYSLIAAPIVEIAQGLVIKEWSLTAGGVIGLGVGLITLCCVVGGVALDANWFMPLFLLAWIVMLIVPGHILNHNSRRK